MSSAFFIVGPTAVGKTGLAVALAEEFGAEIVSADAFQIYEGLDLLTAKPSAEQRRRVPHHLVGYVPVNEAYNVALYLDAARRGIEGISRRGRPTIVVGGSGLYVKALTHGLAPLPAANAVVRAKLEAANAADLTERLRILDPATAAAIDTRNKRRLVRALEVCLFNGQPFSSFRQGWKPQTSLPSLRGVFMIRDRPDQVARIGTRLVGMFEQGVVEEVRANPATAIGAGQILGLQQIQAYLAGQMTLSACREQILVATRQYAKRQVTWFQRETCFTPVNASTCTETELLASARRYYLAWCSAGTKSVRGT